MFSNIIATSSHTSLWEGERFQIISSLPPLTENTLAMSPLKPLLPLYRGAIVSGFLGDADHRLSLYHLLTLFLAWALINAEDIISMMVTPKCVYCLSAYFDLVSPQDIPDGFLLVLISLGFLTVFWVFTSPVSCVTSSLYCTRSILNTQVVSITWSDSHILVLFNNLKFYFTNRILWIFDCLELAN